MRTLCALVLVAAASRADEFTNDLFARLAGREGNVVCSPLSVRVALAMTYAGARGPTADEMAKVLRCDASVHESLAALVRDYDGKPRGNVEMPALADGLWVKEGMALLPAYADLLAKHYGAAPAAIDFLPADAACREINAWVAGRTRDRIREIVQPDMFNVNTRLVIANALHFKAAWQHAFSERATKEQPFALASGEKVQIALMAQTADFPYAERDGARAVELPYAGRRFSMVVVLPREGAPCTLPTGLLEALDSRSVSVFLPRFTLESAFRLEETLQAMGMPTAFGEQADFSGIDGTKDLFISAVAHKAFVAVDEKGTEAAAATAVVMELKGRPPRPVVFRADRPFLFLIRDRESGATLFVGRVSDPRP